MNTVNVSGGQAELSSGLTSSGPYTIHGVALSAGDVTHGSSNTLKKWTKKALSEAAHTLSGKNLVRDHERGIDAVLGTVTQAKYKAGNVLFEAELDDKETAKKIDNGYLDVSARLSHPNTDELEEDSDGNKIISSIKEFIDLSLVGNGASSSNWVTTGSAAELSVAELSAEFEDSSNMISTTYYDEEEQKMKLRRVSEETLAKEQEMEEEPISEEIEELRVKLGHYERRGGPWEGPAQSVRNELIAHLKEEKADVQDEIEDLRSYSSDEEKEDLKTTRRVLDAEIEELRG